MVAADEGHTEVVNLLADKGAQLDLTDEVAHSFPQLQSNNLLTCLCVSDRMGAPR